MPLMKQLTAVAITAELEHLLDNTDEPNRNNGKDSKVIKTGSSTYKLNASRDRAGTFEPQLIKKIQTQLTPEVDLRNIILV